MSSCRVLGTGISVFEALGASSAAMSLPITIPPFVRSTLRVPIASLGVHSVTNRSYRDKVWEIGPDMPFELPKGPCAPSDGWKLIRGAHCSISEIRRLNQLIETIHC